LRLRILDRRRYARKLEWLRDGGSMVWISRISGQANGDATFGDESPPTKLELRSWRLADDSPEPRRQAGARSKTFTAIHVGVTARQLECLAWVAEGKTAAEIGIILGISGRTVEKHVARACELFGVARRIQAVDQARRLGLITDN